jgi:hypothetical protein
VNQGAKIITAATASASDCKKHTFTPAGMLVELPSYTFAVNRGLGTNETIAYSGMTNKTLTWTNAAKDTEKISLAMVGCQEVITQSDVTVAIPSTPPLLVARAKMLIEDASGNLVDFDEVKNVTLVINPNLDDNRVMGSLYPAQPTKQTLSIELSVSANNKSTQYAVRTSYLANTNVSVYMYVDSSSYANATYYVPYSMLIRIPAMFLKEFASPTANKERYVITMNASAVKPVSTVYTDIITVEITDKVTATY